MTQTELIDLAQQYAANTVGGNDVGITIAIELSRAYLAAISNEASLREQLLSATNQLQKQEAKLAEAQRTADGLKRWVASRRETSVFAHRPGDKVRLKGDHQVVGDLTVETVLIERGAIRYQLTWWDQNGKQYATVHQDEVVDADVMKHPYEERT